MRPDVKRIAVLVLTAAPIIGPMDAAGQEDTKLDLGTVLQHTLETHPAMNAAQSRVDGSAAARSAEAAARLPSVVLTGSTTRYQEPMTVTPIHGFDPTQPPAFDETLVQGQATVSYTIFDGSRGARIRQAEARTEQAEAGLVGTRQGVIARVTAVYLDVLARGRMLEAHERRLEALASERARVEQFLEEGQAPRVQLMRVEAAQAAAEAEATSARTALEDGERELARLTGLEPWRTRAKRLLPVELASGIVTREEETARAIALRNNADLERARRGVAEAEASRAATAATRLPSLDLHGTWFERGGLETDFTGEWTVGVQVSVPVFTGGAVGSRVAQAEAGERTARATARTVELDVAAQVDQAVSRIRDARARVAALERAVALQAEVVETERVALEAGVGTQTDYLTAEAELLDARAGLEGARYALMAAHVELARASGTLDEEWIADTFEGRPAIDL